VIADAAAARRRLPSAAIGGVAVGAGLVGLSLALVAPAPSYDPWSWLLWGREVAHGTLDTREGPAFKPLPVAVAALLAPAGGLAPILWVALVRASALLSLYLAYRAGCQLSGGLRRAGVLAVVGVALCGGFLGTAAAGAETPLLLALVLGAREAWRADRHGLVVACALGCALLRVEAWPFVSLAGIVLWRQAPRLRPALAGGAALVPLAWILPELLGSGEPLRSAGRARVPNPGQPALADVPVLAALGEAIRLPLWPLWAGVALLAVTARRSHVWTAFVPAAAGLAWILIVAAMAELGFSGEARYSLPGAALISIGGAVGLALTVRAVDRRCAAALAVGLVAVAAVPRIEEVEELRSRQAYQWALASDLEDAIRASGGRDAVLACGRPYVGPLRGPLMAYRLGVAKRIVEPDDRPRAPGVVFRSALSEGGPAEPNVPGGFAHVARTGVWETWRRCPVRVP
jgi:hypothetical protein